MRLWHLVIIYLELWRPKALKFANITKFTPKISMNTMLNMGDHKRLSRSVAPTRKGLDEESNRIELY